MFHVISPLTILEDLKDTLNNLGFAALQEQAHDEPSLRKEAAFESFPHLIYVVVLPREPFTESKSVNFK